MATSLISVGNQAPGFYGLSLQESSTTLQPQWATIANNAIITSDGRVGARKGFSLRDTIGTTGEVQMLHEYIDATGSSDIIAAIDNKIFKADSPYTTFTDITGGLTITANYWQGSSFNDHAYFFQDAQTPLRWDGTTLQTLASVSGFADSADAVIATKKPNCVHAAYGRLWVGKGSKIWWSDSLSGHIWNAGSAGALELDTVLTQGSDEIVSISSFEDMLVIFMRKSILLYSGVTSTPASNMVLVEHIRGIGCQARDSIQSIGTDLIFLSDSGVRSLVRSIQDNVRPLRDLSKNVRDYLSLFIFGENSYMIKSVFNQKEGFYLLSIPAHNTVFCFDIRNPLQDGAARVTTWDNIAPSAMVSVRNEDLYFGKDNLVGQYTDYLDNGESYTFTYATPWLDYGQPYSVKVMKNFFLLVEAATEQKPTVSWAVDYKDKYESVQKESGYADVYEWGVAKYNESDFGYGMVITLLHGPLSYSGKVMKFKVDVSVKGKFDLKKYEIYAKQGRTL